MNRFRRFLRVMAFVALGSLAILTVALAATQTRWFKDWLQRYVTREAERYLNGQLLVSRLDGNLFTGVQLQNIRVVQNGETLIAAEGLHVDYSLLDLIAHGIVIDDIRLVQPIVRLRRNADGWNVAHLVKEQASEADREGPARPLQISSISIADGVIEIDDRTGADGQAVRLPRRIARIDFKGSFSYEPVNFTLRVGRLSFQSASPSLALNSLTGAVSVRGDDLHFERVSAQTAESSLEVEGMVRNYLGTPVANATMRSARLRLPELQPFVPALEGINLSPAFELKVAGPASAMQTDLHARTEAGAIDGRVTADILAPGRSIRGQLQVANLDASRVLPNLPSTRVNGKTTFDLRLNDDETVRGMAQVGLENTVAGGYAVDRLDATATVDADRAHIDGRARAYGAAATAKGTVMLPISGRQTMAYDVSGRVNHLRAERLPRDIGLPRIATDANARYRVRGEGTRVSADATFDQSTIEGVIVQNDTTAHVDIAGRHLAYSATGAVARVNPRRLGTALGIAALRDDRLDGELDAAFDVEGSGRAADTLEAKADVTIGTAAFPVGQARDVRFTARVARGALDATVAGRFASLDPGRAGARPDLTGSVAGTVDARVKLPSMNAPTVETASGEVTLTLDPSRISGQDVRSGKVDASLAGGVLDVRQLSVDTVTTSVQASGRVALGAAGESNLSYKATAGDLTALGKLAGVADVAGAAVVDGAVTGNRERLRTKGTVILTNARYGTTAEALSTRSEFDVSIPSLDVGRAEGTVNARATLVKAAGREIRDLTLDVRYADQALRFSTEVNEADRRLEARGVAGLDEPGTVDLQLERLALATPKMSWQTPDGAPARIVYTGKAVTLRDLRLANGPQQITASGVVDLTSDLKGDLTKPAEASSATRESAPSSTALTIEVQNADLAQLDDLTVGDRGLGGQLNAKASVAGSIADPVADVELSVTGGAARDFKFERLGGRLHHDDRGAKVELRLDQSPTAWVTADATLPNVRILGDEQARNAAPIDVRVASSPLDLGLVQMFTTAVQQATGTARADLRATGTIGAPVLSGALTVQNGAFVLTGTDTRLQGLEAALRLHEDQVSIDTLRVLDGDGHPLSATGTVGLAERRVGSVNVNVDAQDFRVMNSRFGKLSLDVDLKMAGELAALKVQGDVRVRDGRIEVDRVLEEMGSTAYATESVPIDQTTGPIVPGPEPSPPLPAKAAGRDASATAPVEPASTPAVPETPSLFDSVTVDAHLRVPNNLVLRGDDVKAAEGGFSVGNLNLTVGGDIRATKAPGARPVVVGTIRTIRGMYEFQGRRFDLQRDGTVSFKGPDPTDPTLDITGHREISGIDARVRVHGTAKRPELDISSAPPLDEADVLSLIVFNRPLNELGEGEKGAVGQAAATMVGGLVAAPLAEALRGVLDVDLLEISAGGEAGGGPSVAIGNQIGERVFAKVRQQFGAADVTEFLLDYELTELLRLQTSVVEGAQTNRVPGRVIEQSGVDFVFVVKY